MGCYVLELQTSPLWAGAGQPPGSSSSPAAQQHAWLQVPGEQKQPSDLLTGRDSGLDQGSGFIQDSNLGAFPENKELCPAVASARAMVWKAARLRGCLLHAGAGWVLEIRSHTLPLAWPPPAPGATGGLGCPLRAALPAASTGPGPSPQLQAIAPHLPLSSLSAITFLVSFTRCSNADCLSYARIFIYFRSFQQQVRLIATDCKQASLAQTDLLSVIKVNTKHTHLLQLLPDKPLARSPLSTIQPPPQRRQGWLSTMFILH